MTDWTTMVARRLATTIGEEMPEGIGRWPRAWEVVEAPSRALLAEMASLERGDGDRDRVVRAGVEVREAWQAAAREWEASRAA